MRCELVAPWSDTVPTQGQNEVRCCRPSSDAITFFVIHRQYKIWTVSVFHFQRENRVLASG
jgi:hypothetical protein